MNTSKKTYTTTHKWTLIATILASSLVFIDGAALNVALSALQKDMELSGTQLLWVINGYALFLSALLMVGGSLGDLYGRNKIFLIGVVLFSLSSLACGLSVNATQLLFARVFQGIGGALLTPGSLSILSAHFNSEIRGNAIGLWSTFSALMGLIGPVLGGWLAGLGLWRMIFFLNVPLSIFVFIIIVNKVPETKNEEAEKLDIKGAILVTLGLAGITFGFTESSQFGFRDPVIISTIIIGIVGLIGFLISQQKNKHPMMPLSLFKSSTFLGGNILTLLIYAAMGGALFFIPLNLIQIQGYSEIETGLAMLPLILCIVTISPLMGNYVGKNGYKTPLIIGPFLTAVGYFLFSFMGITDGPFSYFSTFFIPFLILGIGMGITVAPLTSSVMGAIPENNIGIGSGINNTIARAANVLAIALIGTYAILSFKTLVEEKMILQNDLSATDKVAIINETINFSAAQPPKFLQEEQKVQIEDIYQHAFVESFNRVVRLAAILTFFSCFVTFILIKNETFS